ncbi:MAG TPA: glutathione peroxidase [archaeon]|nr:glutathione peroxidase [archaeon]
MLSSSKNLTAVCVTLFVSAIAAFGATKGSNAKALNSPLQFTMADIDSQMVDLTSYKGKVVLIVNVATKCVFTPQYAALEGLYRRYQDRGFVILGFPANNFLLQEPGPNSEIKDFCKSTYGITFPLMSKVSVAGKDICPLYRYLTSEKTNPGYAGELPWNFTKFLVGRQGKVVARFLPENRPQDEAVIKAIEQALAEN